MIACAWPEYAHLKFRPGVTVIDAVGALDSTESHVVEEGAVIAR